MAFLWRHEHLRDVMISYECDVIVVMRLHHRSGGHDRSRAVRIEGHGRAQLLEGQLVLSCLHVHQSQGCAKFGIFWWIPEGFFYRITIFFRAALQVRLVFTTAILAITFFINHVFHFVNFTWFFKTLIKTLTKLLVCKLRLLCSCLPAVDEFFQGLWRTGHSCDSSELEWLRLWRLQTPSDTSGKYLEIKFNIIL